MSVKINHHSTDPVLNERRERVFLVLSGLFLGAMTMLNILGVSRFIAFASWSDNTGLQWGQFGEISFAVAVGVLPYPITFLCTDFISEFYGRARANAVVLTGLLLNVFVVAFLWIGGVLPPAPEIDPATNQVANTAYDYAFFRIRTLTMGAVTASMIAYLAAQLCDVYLFHFWKRLTKGKHLWLRNNGSTLVSQFVDTFAVITITHFVTEGLPINTEKDIWPQLWMFIASGYVFKLVAALIDTVPFYLGVHCLKGYLQLDPLKEHIASEEIPS
ncbi:MAG: queuosine precursor transporter [Planctomycetota bacterium]|jgi:uncharacterized integral membrane protein (TIGR00697 family)